MVLMENDQFLTELTLLYQKCRTSGTVYVTMKKYDGQTKPTPKDRLNSQKTIKYKCAPETSVEGLCLIRATDGKTKLTTHVSAKDINKFQMAYTGILRANIDGLKKHGKKKKSATKKISDQ